jgi:hypothetical protein
MEAECIIEDTPVEKRRPVDPMRFRRWAIANQQAAKVSMYLAGQKKEIEQSIAGRRSGLIDRMEKRRQP